MSTRLVFSAKRERMSAVARERFGRGHRTSFLLATLTYMRCRIRSASPAARSNNSKGCDSILSKRSNKPIRSKSSNKPSYKERRRIEQEKQKRSRLMFAATLGAVVIALALAVILKPKPGPVEFAYDSLPRLGAAEAPVKIVEFGDFKCPTCQYFSREVAPKLKQDYIDKGIASLHYMNFPFLGPDSTTAAIAAQSVFHQSNDAFWTFYDALFEQQGDERVVWATPEFLTGLIRDRNIPVDADKVAEQIRDKTYAEEVEAQKSLGERYKVTGTPTLFVNGVKVENGFDYDNLKKAIEEALQSGASGT